MRRRRIKVPRRKYFPKESCRTSRFNQSNTQDQHCVVKMKRNNWHYRPAKIRSGVETNLEMSFYKYCSHRKKGRMMPAIEPNKEPRRLDAVRIQFL